MADETRIYATELPSHHDRRGIHCKTGMHRLTKVAELTVEKDVKICTAEELATVICEYLDAKLARQAGGADG